MKPDNESQKPDCVFCGKLLYIPVLNNIYRNGLVWNVSECAECQIAMINPFPSEKKLPPFTPLAITGQMEEPGLFFS